jgi:nitrogen regulatory protein P-II 1
LKEKKIRADILPKTKIEIVVEDKEVEKIIDVLTIAASTGSIGDGKIFVSPIEDAIRIRTRERGQDAI